MKNYIHIGCGIQAADEKDDFQKIMEKEENGNLFLVDANPLVLPRIKDKYKDSKFNTKFFNCAIVPTPVNQGEIKLYIPIDSAKSDFSSTNPNFTCAHIHSIEVFQITCRGYTINDFFKSNHIKDIEVLCLDCEGLDVDIIFNLDFETYKPKKIIFEYIHSDGISKSGLKLDLILSFLSYLKYNIEQPSVYNYMAVLKE